MYSRGAASRNRVKDRATGRAPCLPGPLSRVTELPSRARESPMVSSPERPASLGSRRVRTCDAGRTTRKLPGISSNL